LLATNDRQGQARAMVGWLSASVLGGFFGFLASSFLEVSLSAWKQAAKESKKSAT
jgi:hypothetical protein